MQPSQAEDGLGLICFSVFGGSVSKGTLMGFYSRVTVIVRGRTMV